VHDDLQDGDQIRRGKPAVWKKWSAAQAINCGDAFFHFAIELACELEADPETLVRVLRRLTRGTLQVIEGQAQEFLMKEEPFPRVERYLEVATAKTAALVATGVASAMEALRLGEQSIRLAEDAALKAGLLFQLQDDLLDLYGEKQREQRGNDIAEGKVSVLVALFNELASAPDRERLTEILRLPRERTQDAQILEAAGLLEKYRIREETASRIEAIRVRIEDHELRGHAPQVHGLLLELSARFLDPVRLLI
jgi:geranylgeranyl diphosphate synthase type I